ncbi:hypothetical protein [Neobacillus vireti]|uniref:SbsC C-terminal domain-containing protein n=1 Tax=Neobacillus vireti LMG 21834 TaxID=1131730 RepID=A0AB94IRF6_9BACI|nr:hypothetical protein [Neobacillus vireti]ETI69649.1 hypothetical protein BAVI_06284 [Neobacillus vireti LMG 21834]KLT18240.1 hypothetical protein AA980_07830 [Neobacillus vireti]
MFKLTVYKKVNMSRNFFLLILIFLLVLVGGKIIMAHEKIATYKEAMQLYNSGNLRAAEKKFRAAKLNVVVTDHNQDINQKLSILSPIREVIEDLDEKAAGYYKQNDLDKLVDMYNRWQESRKKWVSGTAIQKQMYEEMVAFTKLDQDMLGYFSEIKQTNLAKLQNYSPTSSAEEEGVFNSLKLVPAEYYDGDTKKTKEIQTVFQTYYSGKMNKLTAANAPVFDITAEGERQYGMLTKFSIDSRWLTDTLDSHLVHVLSAALAKKDYPTFAEQANTVKRLSGNMGAAKVFPFIEKSKTDLLANAKKLVSGNKFADAISIYEALRPLENTDQLLANANIAWDKYEPIRVLQRLYPGKEFPNFVNAKNKWGADSVIAAISKDGEIYLGKLKGEEAMVVTEGSIQGSATISKLVFQSNLSQSDYPVIYIEAKSSERKHRYLAYEVRANSMGKILDVEADNLTIEARNVLLADNPTGSGAGQLAYYEPVSDGDYQFTKIKVDYVDISVNDIAQYYGKKVRFTAFSTANQNGGALVTLSETYNYSTNSWEKTYLLLKGQTTLIIYRDYTVIGTFTSYTNITDDYGEQIRVPVFQIEKIE